MIQPSVEIAIRQIRDAFAGSNVEVQEDGDGGAYVVVDPVTLASIYEDAETWIGFRITFPYPAADVYPHFVRSDLRRRDGRALGDGMSIGQTFNGRPCVQISRRSNRLNPATDTAALKLQKVLTWLNNRT